MEITLKNEHYDGHAQLLLAVPSVPSMTMSVKYHVIPSAFALCSNTRQLGCLLTRLLTNTTAIIKPKGKEKQSVE